MRIAHLDDLAIWGGGQNQALLLHLGLIERGLYSEIWSRPGSPLAQRVPGGAQPFAPRFELDVVEATRVARTVRARAIELVHAHTARAHAIARLAQLIDPEIRLVVSRRVNLPVRSHGLSRLKYRYGVSRYIAVCEAIRRTLVLGGVSADRVSVVYSCARNWRGERPPHVPPSAGEPWTIAWAGRLESNKRPLDAVRALARLRERGVDARLVLAGHGSLRRELEREVEARGLCDAIRFSGHQGDVESLLAGAQALVFTSDGAEGCPNVVLEAMAAGVPVVASRVDGVPEILEDGRTGLLFHPHDVHGLTQALLRLHADSPLVRSLAEKAWEDVRDRFTPDQLAAGTITAYETALQSDRP